MSLDAPERILVRAPNWVGDVVMATPALRALRRAQPGAEIVLEGRAYLREILGPLSTVDCFMVDPGRGISSLRHRVRELRKGRFDWALMLPDSQSSALGPFLARIPLRVGCARDPLRRALLTRSIPTPTEDGVRVPISMIERYLRVTRAAGCADAGRDMEIVIRDEWQATVDERLEAVGLTGERLLLAIPGASYGSSKLWPAHRFAAACDGIGHAHGLVTVLAPGPGEEEVAREVTQGMGLTAAVLCDPVLSLGELAALAARASLVVTNDTGPRQIAVALGVPTVVVMGPTDPRHTNHHLDRQRVLREDVECSPCGLKVCPIDHRCMTGLDPERVIAAADELLTQTATT